MDWKTFTTELISSVIWPLTTLVALFALRQKIGLILQRILRVKHGDTEVEFQKALNNIEHKASFLEHTTENPEESSNQMRLLGLIEALPRAAVIQSWYLVDREVSDLFIRSEIEPANGRFLKKETREFLRSKGLSASDYKTLRQLKVIATDTMGEQKVSMSPDSIESYIELCIDIARKIRNFKGKRVSPVIS